MTARVSPLRKCRNADITNSRTWSAFTCGFSSASQLAAALRTKSDDVWFVITEIVSFACCGGRFCLSGNYSLWHERLLNSVVCERNAIKYTRLIFVIVTEFEMDLEGNVRMPRRDRDSG